MNPIRRALAETEGRPDLDSLENGGFHWHTADGVFVRPDQMETLHLFHTVRLLWNHTVPSKQQFKPFRVWDLTLDAEDREEAMKEMLAELGRRVDKGALTAAQRAELVTIRLKDKVWLNALAALPISLHWGDLDEGDVDPEAEAFARDELREMGDR